MPVQRSSKLRKQKKLKLKKGKESRGNKFWFAGFCVEVIDEFPGYSIQSQTSASAYESGFVGHGKPGKKWSIFCKNNNASVMNQKKEVISSC